MIRSITVVLVIVGLGCNGPNKNNGESLIVNEVLPEKIKLKDLNGRSVDLGIYKGKTIFINFWATWCNPCLREMPSIHKAQHLLRNKDVVFLLASSESIEEIEAFKVNNDYDFNYVSVENSEALNIQALPTTFIFNPKGKLVFMENGFRKWDDENNIEMILKMAK